MRFSITTCVVALSLYSHVCFAWGERGHDLITRVAVQKMRVDTDDNSSLMRPFLLRDHMLGHLSNTPDIVWRADYMGDEAKSANSPTHYINIEKVIKKVEKWDDFPRDFAEFRFLCKSKGMETTDVGTAPWRVLQFYKLMVQELSGLENKPLELQTRHINQALMYAGLMSHFVADLANPHHTTANYDGQLTGNRGLHSYFESIVVAELSFKLPSKVLNRSLSPRLWLRDYTRKERKKILQDPQKLVWALTVDSNKNVERLTRLDDRFSIIKKSLVDSESRERAVRKPAKDIAYRYEKFAVDRMAIGSYVLAQLWRMAWQDAGSPDMSEFRSYYYPVQPPFITPFYD